MDSIRVIAPAKINLTLDILNKTDLGYHNLSSVIQSLDLFDYVTIKISDGDTINIYCPMLNIAPEKNLAYITADKYLKYVKLNKRVDILIEKNIPSEAGLGGGSADAAAVLFGLNILCDNILDNDAMIKIASEIGSDVPFFLFGGTCACSGIGTNVKQINSIDKNLWILLIKPDFGFSTKEMYRLFDENNSQNAETNNTSLFINALTKNDTNYLNFISNDFIATAHNETINKILSLIDSFGAIASSMTGSGSCLFGIFDDEEKALNAKKEIKGLNTTNFLARPFSKGTCIDNSFKVENVLKKLKICYKRINHPAVYTMDEMYKLGIFNDGIIGKNLFIRDSKGKRHFLIFVYGDKKVSLEQIENELGIKHISFGSAERLYSHLGITKGSVSPLGVINNSEADVEFIIDEDFKTCKSIGIHPNQNTSIFWLSFEDLIKIIEENGNKIVYFHF